MKPANCTALLLATIATGCICQRRSPVVVPGRWQVTRSVVLDQRSFYLLTDTGTGQAWATYQDSDGKLLPWSALPAPPSASSSASVPK